MAYLLPNGVLRNRLGITDGELPDWLPVVLSLLVKLVACSGWK